MPSNTTQRMGVLGPLLAALVSAAGIAWGLADPPVRADVNGSPPATLGASASALLGGLAQGDTLVGWRVTAVTGPDGDGAIRVQLVNRDVAFSLMVSPLQGALEQAPVQTEHWAIYYGHVRPADASLSRNVITATTHALANRVRKHE